MGALLVRGGQHRPVLEDLRVGEPDRYGGRGPLPGGGLICGTAFRMPIEMRLQRGSAEFSSHVWTSSILTPAKGSYGRARALS